MGLSWKKLKRGALGIATFGGSEIGRKLDNSSPGGPPGDWLQKRALREGFGAQLASESQALGAIPKAYEKATAAIMSGKGAALQRTADAGMQQNAANDQALASRGLYNTTILDNARQGTAAGVARAQSDIESKYASIRAELGLAEHNATQQARSRIGQIHANFGQAMAGQYNRQQQVEREWALANNPDEWLDSLLQVAGTAVGFAVGGPVGAAAGSQLAGGYNEGWGGN